jgi:hypothetical protein
MHFKNLAYLAGAAAVSSVLGFSAPAEAFSFGTSGIQFDKDTTATFNFINSQGVFTSTLKVVQVLDSGAYKDLGTLFAETRASDASPIVGKPGSKNNVSDWLGTCGAGKTVLNCTASFVFQQGVKYAFMLESFDSRDAKPTTTQVFSTTALNLFSTGGKKPQTQQSQQAKFFNYNTTFPTVTEQKNMKSILSTKAGLTNSDPYASPILVAFDDRGNGNDKDFNDFKFTASTKAVPEPTTLAGLSVVAGTLALSRRRRAANKAI